MKRIAFAILALTLAACSGNFDSGTSMPNGAIPPVGPSNPPPYGTNGIPQNVPGTGASASPMPTYSPGTYALSEAPGGFQCPPTTDGYSCTLRFNIPAPTPTPGSRKTAGKAVKSTATPSASPSPSPTPSPADTPPGSPSPLDSASPAPTATASASPAKEGATVSLQAKALPKDAPPMYHLPKNTLDVVPLMLVHITPNADFTLNGPAQAQFTLPKDQTVQRGFAVQLFQAKSSKHRTNYTPVWTFDKSTLKDGTLTFDFTPPKMTIPKNSSYVLVLYGDDKSKVSPSPAGTAQPSATPAAAASAAPAATATP